MSRPICAAIVAGCALLAAPSIAFAGDAEKYPNEFTGSLSYNDIEDVTITMLELSYGRYLTEMHEVGFTVSYLDMDVDDFGGLDGSELGLFYHLNIPTSGSATPFLGINANWIGGDLGDAFDFGYGASAGVKVYPFENGGFIFSVVYQELEGASGFSNVNSTGVNVGIMLRF